MCIPIQNAKNEGVIFGFEPISSSLNIIKFQIFSTINSQLTYKTVVAYCLSKGQINSNALRIRDDSYRPLAQHLAERSFPSDVLK